MATHRKTGQGTSPLQLFCFFSLRREKKCMLSFCDAFSLFQKKKQLIAGEDKIDNDEDGEQHFFIFTVVIVDHVAIAPGEPLF